MSKKFYDSLTPYYHLIFNDWDASIINQAKIIDHDIHREWGDSPETILDVSCGIGTQAIGLAQLGYTVDASDLSPEEIKRAIKETSDHGLMINYSVADMKQAYTHHQKKFDILISCDNSVPHLLTDSDILVAFKEFYRCLKIGGGCLITLRDYDKEKRQGIQVKPYGVRVVNGIKYVMFQTWEFEGDIYNLTMYVICDGGKQDVKTNVFRSTYYAVSTSKIMELMNRAGFRSVKEAVSDYYQPVIVGTREV